MFLEINNKKHMYALILATFFLLNCSLILAQDLKDKGDDEGAAVLEHIYTQKLRTLGNTCKQVENTNGVNSIVRLT